MTEQELNKKLTQWRFPDATSIDVDEHGIWVHNPGTFDSTGVSRGSELIELFTQSLDACDKWLVPKLHSYYLELHDKQEGKIRHRFLAVGGLKPSGQRLMADYIDKTVSLALCKAIEKLVDLEK